MNKSTLLFSTLPLALGGLCGCRTAANPLHAERTPTTTPVVRRLAGETTPQENYTHAVDLGTLSWNRTTASSVSYYYFVVDMPSAFPIVSRSCYVLDTLTNGGWGYIEQLTADDMLIIQPNSNRLLVREDSLSAGSQLKTALSGKYIYYQTTASDANIYTEIYDEGHSSGMEEGYTTGYDQGRSQGYTEGYDAGVAQATGELVLNENYTGLYAFYNQYYLSHWADDIEAGYITSLDHFFVKFSAENYEFDLYFYEMDGEGETFSGVYEIFASVEANGTTMHNRTKVGQLCGYPIADGDYSSSWIYQFNPTTFSFTTIKQSANEVAPINFGRQMTLHHYANLNGAKNFIIGKGNQYAEGYNAGHQDTIEATEAFNNVFTIFGKAFSAVSSFLNLNIGPFKMWYFLLMPIIVALFILVLRLVKH